MYQTNKAVYAATIKEFLNDVAGSNFLEKMKEGSYKIGLSPSDSEIKSWIGNCKALNNLFRSSTLPNDVVVAFEYRAPVGGRVDCMLFGKGTNGKNNIVLFELKGWVDAKLSYNNTLIETVTGERSQDVEHPSAQAERYHTHFTNFIELLNTDDYCLTSLAYCYNYKKKGDGDALFHDNFKEVRDKYPLFIQEDESKLADLLHSLLEKGEGQEVFDKMASWHIAPTRKLIEAAADIVIDKDNFYLLGDQDVAFKKFESILKDSLEKEEKSVIVIKGGPGTGKTVIALKMLSAVAKMGKTPMLATRSTALRDQLRNALKGVKVKTGKDASDLITDIYMIRPSRYQENELDLLIIDEAHRVAENANADKTGRLEVTVEHEGEGNSYCPLSQATALIYCSKVTVFFIDDHQAVKSTEIGKSDKIINKAQNYQKEIEKDIEKFVKEQKKREQKREKLDEEKKRLDENSYSFSQEELAKKLIDWNDKSNDLDRELKWINCLQHVKNKYQGIVRVPQPEELTTQFRCSGGDKFVAWLDEVLYKKPENISILLDESDFNFEIFDNPTDLYNQIKELNNPDKRETARLCAGWCWPWSDKQVDKTTGDLKKEVDLSRFGYDFAMPWETKQKPSKEPFKSKYAIDTNSWASDPMGINQVGCIHTAQGFEFDYVGVIVGPDLIYDDDNDCLKCIGKENKERQLPDKYADILVRNIYRVLLSRGKYGCYMFCCDPQVADYFKRFMIKK